MNSCEVTDCFRPHKAKGLCAFHYQRKKKGVPFNAPKKRYTRMPEKLCSVSGCKRRNRAKGFCKLHYDRFRNGYEINAPKKLSFSKLCKIKGCFSKMLAKGLCSLHYERMAKGKDLLAKKKRRSGDGCITSGYKVLTIDRVARAEHRWIMERILGRRLSREEHVHHIDKNKLNNSPDNLELISASQHPKKHAKYFSGKSHKQCHTCLMVKPRSEFHRGKDSRWNDSDTHDSRCRECSSEYWFKIAKPRKAHR